MNTIHMQGAAAPPSAARDKRRQLLEAGLEQHRRVSERELQELFGHRLDGVAAARRFSDRLRWHVAVFGDGTSGTSAARILGDLIREERRLQRARAGAG